MSTASPFRLSPHEYLARERAASSRSEYFGGEVFAMAGATADHNRIVRNVLALLDGQLRGGPCEVFPSDLRLACPSGLLTYPDLQVVCGELEYFAGENDTITNPRLIVEVLSKSTERYDRGDKFAHYRGIPSLIEYVLVSHREPRIERYVRDPKPGWLMTEACGLGAAILLETIGCQLGLADVYRDVKLPSSASSLALIRDADDEARQP
jgi:Uma2 family endonuclease